MRTDLVLLDLDGTLLNDEKLVSSEDKNALWDLSNSGIYICYVTSRTGRRIHELLNGLPCDVIALLNGGDIRITRANGCACQLYDGINGSSAIGILDELYKNETADIAAFFDQHELWNGRITEKGNDVGSYCEFKSILKNNHCQRIRIYKRQLDVFKNRKDIYVYYENGDTIIESCSVNKESAVQAICRVLEISSDNIIAFGDSNADIPMLKFAGTGVAMSNASDIVKEAADELTLSNNESGVGIYLTEKLGLRSHIHSVSLEEDKCIYLLKDVSGQVPVISADEKRKRLKTSSNSRGILARDPMVMPETVKLFREKTIENRQKIAEYVGFLSEKLYYDADHKPVLVSLARGGIITGALCKYYIETIYGKKVPHYTISLIRKNGIDSIALSDIVNRHGYDRIRFIDGWTGSGLISKELEQYVSDYNLEHNTDIDKNLSVLADTSHVCRIYGTREDVFMPECCLNATICGLLSSVIMCSDDYHGAMIFDELASEDQTIWYYKLISKNIHKVNTDMIYDNVEFYGRQLQLKIYKEMKLDSEKKVRLGLGESTRAIFRSDLKELLVKDPEMKDIAYILHLARQKGIKVKQYDTSKYNCIAILE